MILFYRNNDGNVVNTMSIVIGLVTSMEIPVMIQNNGDDAFGDQSYDMTGLTRYLSQQRKPNIPSQG